MIQPLRSAHRRAFVTLAIVLPVILAVGLASRYPQLRASSSPDETLGGRFVMKKSDRMWRQHAIVTEFYGDARDPGVAYVALRPSRDLNEPDLLLYWTEVTEDGDKLPPDARLLGAFAPGKLFSLDEKGSRSGRLVLYSGAHREIVDTSRVEALP